MLVVACMAVITETTELEMLGPALMGSWRAKQIRIVLPGSGSPSFITMVDPGQGENEAGAVLWNLSCLFSFKKTRNQSLNIHSGRSCHLL